MKHFFYILTVSFLLFSCKGKNNADSSVSDSSNPEPPLLNYNVIRIYPHDTASYTEGFIWYNNQFYESTGNPDSNKNSVLRVGALDNAAATKEVKLDKQYFGEGIAILKGKIYQLTWKNNKVFVYDLATLKKIGELSWPHDGWGMTTDGKSLILTTGDSNLYFVNPDNFQVEKIVSITNNFGPVDSVNELEYVDGVLYANRWLTNTILKIDPATGKVIGQYDLTDINQKNNIAFTPGNDAVLNGIAYNPQTKTFYITGKNWPNIFEVKL